MDLNWFMSLSRCFLPVGGNSVTWVRVPAQRHPPHPQQQQQVRVWTDSVSETGLEFSVVMVFTCCVSGEWQEVGGASSRKQLQQNHRRRRGGESRAGAEEEQEEFVRNLHQLLVFMSNTFHQNICFFEQI